MKNLYNKIIKALGQKPNRGIGLSLPFTPFHFLLLLLLFSIISFQPSICRAQSDSVLSGKDAIDSWLADGDQHYRMGNYDMASGYYGLVLSTGYASADLYYNLGNAFYRTDQLGLAILNYKRALRLNPSMSDARENLALAESKTVDRITVLPKLFIVRWVDTLCTHLSPAAWRVVWLVLLALVGLSVVTLRLGTTRGLRKAGFVVGLLTLLLLLAATFLLLRATRQYNAHSEAVVLAQAITVKSSPEVQSADKLILHEGTFVTINDSLADWYKVTIADGTTGWCQGSDIERI